MAALLGFVAGKGQFLDSFLPPSLRDTPVNLEPLETAQAAQASELARLQSSVAEIDIPDLDPVLARIDVLEAAVNDQSTQQDMGDANAEIEERLRSLSEKVAELESRPLTASLSEDVVAGFEAELERVRNSLTEQQAEVERMVADAQDMERVSAEAARIASAQSVVARLRSALDAGNPFSGLLDELARLQVAVPEELKTVADTGVVTLSGLQDQFPPAARSALAASREETKDTGGLIDFVHRHLGARSVVPREGDDPDAILSRAGAAVDEGHIAAALQELTSLPEAGQAAVSEWQMAAKTRLDAEAATAALSQSLNAN